MQLMVLCPDDARFKSIRERVLLLTMRQLMAGANDFDV